MPVIYMSDIVSWTMALDRPRYDIPWNTSSIRLSVFHHSSSITVTRSLDHKTYEHMDTIWTWQGYQTLCPWQGNYKDDLCSYRIVLHCVAWCSCGNCYSDDGEIHSGAPLMHHGVRHRLAGHVTKLLCHRNIDDAEWVKEYMPGNEDNVIVSPRAM